MMEFQILSEKFNEYYDKIYNIYIKPSDLIVFCYIVESLEGWAFHTIIDKEKSILHLEIMNNYINDFEKILKLLNKSTE